jgi:hypothetical protein
MAKFFASGQKVGKEEVPVFVFPSSCFANELWHIWTQQSCCAPYPPTESSWLKALQSLFGMCTISTPSHSQGATHALNKQHDSESQQQPLLSPAPLLDHVKRD